jgi:phosphoribosylaminoimidazole-succinocarboxamide synthase
MTTVPTGKPLLATELSDVDLIHRGKVRDVYQVGDELLLVATDRVSAFDVVLPGGVPSKGTVLTQLSCFWFDRLQHVVSNHLISADVDEFPAVLRPFADQLAGRSMYARRAERFDVECVVRGYLIGSGWRDYQRTGEVCGIELPPDLQQADRLPEPIFTPSTKADSGHDENVSVAQMAEMIGPEWTARLAEVSLQLYSEAAEYAESRGIIIADTKFEFGLVGGELILIDEALTPDSSRFWPAAEYRPGTNPPSYDKEFVRDYLSHLDWNKTAPGPVLPDDIVQRTSAKYHEAYEVLTGTPLPDFS